MLSAFYNIENKYRLNLLDLPNIQSTFSLGIGALIPSVLWNYNLRDKPFIDKDIIKMYIPISFLHYLGHLTAIMSTSDGSVAFTQIIKSCEPVYTALLGWYILGNKLDNNVIFSLIVIVAGVSISSFSGFSFSMVSFITAMVSNLCFSMRNIYSKQFLKSKNIDKANIYDTNKYTDISPQNVFGIITTISFFFSIPLGLIDVGRLMQNYKSSLYITQLTRHIFLTGISFYLYNECAMVILKLTSPVTQSIINTIKRIFILATSIIVFNTPISTNGIIGSIIAVIGSYLYSKFSIKNK